MRDLFDTAQVRDDPEHWDALAERIAATAARGSRQSGFGWLAHSRAGWVVAASLLLAAVLAFMMQPAEGSPARRVNSEWAEALAPTDEVGKAIVFRDRPPALGALLLAGRAAGAR